MEEMIHSWSDLRAALKLSKWETVESRIRSAHLRLEHDPAGVSVFPADDGPEQSHFTYPFGYARFIVASQRIQQACLKRCQPELAEDEG